MIKTLHWLYRKARHKHERKASRTMNNSSAPGRGRPPKNTVWSKEYGRYVPRKPPGRPPSGTSWDSSVGEYVSSVHQNNEQSTTRELIREVSLSNSWNSDDMYEAVFHVGPRQNPYRNCTRDQRDSSGQYQDGFYAVCGYPKKKNNTLIKCVCNNAPIVYYVRKIQNHQSVQLITQ